MRSLALALMPLVITLVACDDSDNRQSGRDTAALKACDYYERCEGFASGKTYSSRENCTLKLQATFEEWWKPEECEGRIDQSSLDLCYAAIDTAECGSGGDFLHALDKCQRANICDKPATK